MQTILQSQLRGTATELGRFLTAQLPSIGGESWWDRNDTATFDQRLDAKTIWVGARSWRELGYGSDAPKKPFNPTIINGGKN